MKSILLNILLLIGILSAEPPNGDCRLIIDKSDANGDNKISYLDSVYVQTLDRTYEMYTVKIINVSSGREYNNIRVGACNDYNITGVKCHDDLIFCDICQNELTSVFYKEIKPYIFISNSFYVNDYSITLTLDCTR
jgi:hypothetical protein